MVAVAGFDSDELLDIAGSLEHNSEHPLGRAVVALARQRELGFRAVDGFEAVAGLGVRGTLDGVEVLIGNRRMLQGRGIDLATLEPDAARHAADGATISYVAIAGRLAGLIAIADPIKPGAAEAVRALESMGIIVWLLTGDARLTADSVARQVGIRADRVIAEVLPGGQGSAGRASPGRGAAGRHGWRRDQ